MGRRRRGGWQGTTSFLLSPSQTHLLLSQALHAAPGGVAVEERGYTTPDTAPHYPRCQWGAKEQGDGKSHGERNGRCIRLKIHLDTQQKGFC